MAKFRMFCSLLIIIALIIPLAGCGSTTHASGEAENKSGEEVTAENSALSTESTTEAATEPAPTFEEVVIVDNDECTIKITDIDPSNIWGYTLKVFLENKSPDKTYMYAIRGASVDGIDTDPGFAAEVAPGKKSNKEISFSDDMLEELGIDFTDIEMTFRVYDSDDWSADPVAFETVNIYPYGPENATCYVREPKDTDTVLVDNEYITAIVTGYEPDGMWGYTVELFLVNKTSTSAMFTVDEESINGYMMDPFWATSVLPGNCKFSSMSWSNSDFEENGITTVEEIEFMFSAYDEENFYTKYIEEVFVLNP